MACVTAIWREQEAKKHKKKKTPWPAKPPKHGSVPPPYGYIHLVSKNVASLSKFPLCADMKSTSEKCPLMHLKSEMYPFQRPTICNSDSSDIRQ